MKTAIFMTVVSFVSAAMLAGCSSAQVEDFNTSLASIATSINTDISTIAADDLPAACTLLKALDGDFQAAAALSSSVKAQADLEAVAVKGVDALCAAPPATDVVQAVTQVVAAAKTVQTALKATN